MAVKYIYGVKDDEEYFIDIAKEIAKGEIVEGKQECDFDIELVVKQANEIDRLQRSLNIWTKYAKYWKFKYKKANKQKHVYKVEMERLRRKLTRIYDYYKGWNECIVDHLKRL